MKLFFIFVIVLISQFSFAQIKSGKIFNDIEEMNEGSINEVFKYDESTKTIHYQMYFSDSESFKVYTHFKSVETIFQDTFNKLNSNGVLKKVISLGVVDVKLVIKSETTGEVLESKLLNLGVAKANSLLSSEAGS